MNTQVLRSLWLGLVMMVLCGGPAFGQAAGQPIPATQQGFCENCKKDQSVCNIRFEMGCSLLYERVYCEGGNWYKAGIYAYATCDKAIPFPFEKELKEYQQQQSKGK